VFDCPARERRGKCAAKLAEPDAVGIIPLKAFNKHCWNNARSLAGYNSFLIRWRQALTMSILCP
jgi:hypothetical protein